MTKGQRIKEVMIENKLSQKKVAFDLGITTRYLRDILKDVAENPSPRIFDTFCFKYGVNKDWIEEGEGSYKNIFTTVQIPVLARCPAGFPEDIIDGIIEYLALPDVPPKTYAIIVTGDSMSPAIKDGEYALFIQAAEIHDGDVVIAKNEWNECMVKRYRIKGDKALLTSDNPDYPTVEPNEHYKIIGKVIKVISRRKRF